MKISRKRLKEIIEEEMIAEAYYGGIPGEPETPAGYGGALDAAKVQQHLSDEIDDLVRLGKIDINDLSVETVRANQEIPWDKFQAIDDEVLGDIIRDYQRRRKFYKEGRVITPGVANDLTTQMNNLAGALQKFDPSALQGQPASDLRAAWIALESSMGDVFGDGLENAAVPTRKPLEEGCGMEAPGALTDEPMPMPGPPPEPNRALEPVYDDDEGHMVKGQLSRLVNDADELTNLLGDQTQLPSWVQAKVTKATDYISAVKNYLQYQQQVPQGLHEMKISKQRIKQIIKEEFLREGFFSKEEEPEPETRIEAVDPLILEEMQELTDLVEKFFRGQRFDVATGARKELTELHDQWTEDLWRAFADRQRRIEKGYFGPPPKGVQASYARTMSKTISNVLSNLADFTKAIGAGLTAAPALVGAATDLKSAVGAVNEIDTQETETAQEVIEYEKTAMDYMDEILSRLRSPTLRDVYLTDIEEIVQQIRTKFKAEVKGAESLMVSMTGNKIVDEENRP
jgi:hypothetical protein